MPTGAGCGVEDVGTERAAAVFATPPEPAAGLVGGDPGAGDELAGGGGRLGDPAGTEPTGGRKSEPYAGNAPDGVDVDGMFVGDDVLIIGDAV